MNIEVRKLCWSLIKKIWISHALLKMVKVAILFFYVMSLCCSKILKGVRSAAFFIGVALVPTIVA
jgi:hypothetical protein